MEEKINDAKTLQNSSYRGNPLLKRTGEIIEFTKEHIEEYRKCMTDVVYFAENYMMIVNVDKGLIPLKMYEYQKKILKSIQDNNYSILLSCRQSGKCCAKNTHINILHEDFNSGKPFSIEIGTFYKWIKFRNQYKDFLKSSK